jgi:hypothetical protein
LELRSRDRTLKFASRPAVSSGTFPKTSQLVFQSRLYFLGGETGGGEIDGKYYGHHPGLLLISTMRLKNEVRELILESEILAWRSHTSVIL